MIVGVLLVLPILPLPILQVFWLGALGVLFLGRWPNERGPAWDTGDPDPWPTAAELRAEAEAEAACIGAQDEDTGQAIVAFVTLEGSGEEPEGFDDEIRQHVAEKIGKLARPKRIVYADDLPKTRSGKIMRRLLKDIAEGRELGDVTTLRDPAVTEKIKEEVAAGREE